MKGQRRRLSASHWQGAIQRFDQGEETVANFCAREGLCVGSFYRWRTRLSATGQAPSSSVAASAARVVAHEHAASQAGFIDLGPLVGSPLNGRGHSNDGGTLELRLDLGGGLVLQIVRR